MTRTILIATVLIAKALPVAADTASPDVRPLPAHVAAGVAELRTYGTRFDKVIAAIEAEAAKPSWGWDGGECGHDGDEMSLPAM